MLVEVKKITIYSAIVVVICLAVYALTQWRMVIDTDDSKPQRRTTLESLPPLDARGVGGIREITKSELLTLIPRAVRCHKVKRRR